MDKLWLMFDLFWPTIKWVVAVLGSLLITGLSILFSWLGTKTPFRWTIF